MKYWNGYRWCESTEQKLPEVTTREDRALVVGPPPDGRSIEEHLDELVGTRKKKAAKVIEKNDADADLYPAGWPRCPGCDKPALDGHITCGDVLCDEAGRR